MSGYSYQDLKQKLEIVEEKVDFVLKSIPVKVQSKVVGPDGRSQPVVTNLLEVFQASRRGGWTPNFSDELEDMPLGGDGGEEEPLALAKE